MSVTASCGHLAELGWRDIVQIDKGPLPNPGGSTGHASNFIFPVDHNREMATLNLDSQRQYIEMGVNTECGGIEIAREPARMEELRRRMVSAKNWGIPARLVTPAEIKEMVPFINEEILLGGFYSPTVSVVDSLRAGTIFRERAQALGALQTFANVEVEDLIVEDGGDQGGGHRPRSHRCRLRRHRVRRVEPQNRRDGRRRDPAHPSGAPDDRRWSDSGVGGHQL